MSINVSGVQASQAGINAVLEKMRTLRAQAQTSMPPMGGVDAAQTGVNRLDQANQTEFGATLKNAIDSVNKLQKTSSATANDFLTGRSDDLVKVMVDSQKSKLGFQALLQARNRVVSAYQDIMNMPI